jgi:hypothetical protein
MKNIPFLFVFACFSLFFAQRSGAQCYVRLEDASGFKTDAYQDTLQAAAAKLCAIFDSTGFAGQFKVYDFGFYLHQENTTGGYPEPFAQKMTEVQDSSPYYLLFGKQTDKSGVYTRFWVDLVLPDTGEFECIDLMSPFLRNDLIKKFESITNQNHEDGGKTPDNYSNVEISVIDSVKNYFVSFFECCDLGNRRLAGCNTCAFSESQFSRMLVEDYGFFENQCFISKKADLQLQNEDGAFNRIINEDGDLVNIDDEIDKMISDFNTNNPDLNFKIFTFKYPENCINFESLWDEYYSDNSDSKMIIGLVGRIGGSGKIFWQTSGSAPIHYDYRDIGYTVTKKQNSPGYDVHVTLNVKIINISNVAGGQAQIVTDNLKNFSSQTFSGDFTSNIKNNWLPCSGYFHLKASPVNNLSQISSSDHIMALVDDFPKGDLFFPAGRAELDKSISSILISMCSNNKLGLHELGHNLGFDDDYDHSSIMGDLNHAKYATTSNQRRALYGQFIFNSSNSGTWRNLDRSPGSSIDDLKEFLTKNNVKYDKSKLH